MSKRYFVSVVTSGLLLIATPAFAWTFENYSHATTTNAAGGIEHLFSVDITDSTDCAEQTYTIQAFTWPGDLPLGYPIEREDFLLPPTHLPSGTGTLSGQYASPREVMVSDIRITCLYTEPALGWTRWDTQAVGYPSFLMSRSTPISLAEGGTGSAGPFTTGSVMFISNGRFTADSSLSWDESTNQLTVQKLAVNDGLEIAHLKGIGSTPGIATGSCLGGGSVSIRGTDTAGQVTLTTGVLPILGGTCATVTFASSYGSAPFVSISPANGLGAAAIDLMYVTSTVSTFQLVSSNVALAPLSVYRWNYHVIE